MIAQLVYTSHRHGPMDRATLDAMLARARENNARLGVTGVLLCTPARFLQVIEGPPKAVQALADRIAEDPRHDGMRVVWHREVAQRDFGEWQMALSVQAEPAATPGGTLARFFAPDFDLSVLPASSAASFLLRAFREIEIEGNDAR